MRPTTQKLSLSFVALLLAHCALPGESEPAGSDEAASTLGDTFDNGSSLTELRATSSSPRTRSSDPAADAIAYLTGAAESAGVTSPEFKVRSVATGADGLTHVRAMQVFDGIEVFGADSVVHLTSGSVVGATGSVARGLEGTTTKPSVSNSEALSKAKRDRFGSNAVETSREQVSQVIYLKKSDRTPALGLHTAFFNELQGDVQPAFWHHIYDAKTGELVARWNELHTIEQASGPGGNPKWEHSWNGELDVEAQGDDYVLTTSALKTINLKNTSGGGSEVTGALESIGDAPINDAHGFAEITLEVLSYFGHDSINDNGYRIVSRVHYGTNYENAYWDGSQMTYGDGKNTFYPLSGSLDVVAHEIHHGFTTFHSNLRYSGQSGGLNESFSDIAGKVAEFYYKPAGNFDLGADVFKAEGKALRYMCDPKKDGRSIDHASQMTSYLDVHYSSGVQNKAFCVAAKRFSNAGAVTGEGTKEGVLRAAKAWYLANASYWTASTTFVQGGQGVVDAARALEYSADEVSWLQASWSDVGVTTN